MKRPNKTEFICTKCKTHEFIPTNIVLQMDIMDLGDPAYPPMFHCEKCNGLMKPKYLDTIILVNNSSMMISKYSYFFLPFN